MNDLRSLQAIIWDMDGVLIDSLPTHVEAWLPILQRYGYNYTYEEMIPLFGMTDATVLRSISGGRFSENEVASLTHEKEIRYQELIHKKTRPLPGVVKWLNSFHDAGLKQALASSSDRTSISIILNSLGIYPFFDAIVSGVGGPSKPDPTIFLKAAEQLEIPPTACLVIEDAAVGVQAAKAGGMYCVAVTTTTTAENLKRADLIVNNLDQLEPSALIKILR